MFRVQKRFFSWALAVLMFASPTWGYAQQPAKIDLSYVTPGAVLAAVAHPRRVLTAPEMEMMPIEVLSAAGKKELGIDPLDLQQVMLIAEPPQAGPPDYGAVLRLDRPYRLDALRLPPDLPLAEDQLDGRPYQRSQNPMMPGFYMPDEQTLLVGTDSMIRKMLANQKSPAEGPLSKLMARTDNSADALAVVVIEPIRPMMTAQLAGAPFPPPFAAAKRLPELIDAAKADLRVTGRPGASLVLLAPSDAAAAELDRLLVQLLDTGQQMVLAQVAGQMQSDDPVEQAGAQYAQRMTRRTFEALRPQREGRALRLSQDGVAGGQVATIGILVALLLPAVQAAREAARRMSSTNNLKQIALAMHNYHDTYKKFPPRASFDAQGKPLLSWRVHLLPFLEQQALYEQFHLDEPWDSEHNKKLIEAMPEVYRNPSASSAPGRASYLVPAGKGSIFEGQEGTSIAKIKDGTSNTILVLEVNDDASVVWTRPDDLNYDPDKPLVGLGSAHPGGFNTALADGSVHWISATIDPQVFLRLLMMADGQPVGQF